MKGEFLIEVKNADVYYKFTIHRNITVICGDGASGKSILYNLVDTYNNTDKQGISIHVTRGATLETLSEQRFHDGVLKNASRGNRIFIIEEDMPFVYSNDFAVQAKESGYYFILINRDKLDQISCSIHEIYEIEHLDVRLVGLKRRYEGTRFGTFVNTDNFVTEDSNSGRQFFSRVYNNATVNSANGRDNICKIAEECIFPTIFIVDGAAFGFNMIDTLPLIQCSNSLLIAEESFEYVILKSGIVHPNVISQLDLDAPDVDCSQYMSWEQYYTDLLLRLTANDFKPYKKDHLPQSYSSCHCAKKILRVYDLPMPETIIKAEPTDLF